LDFCHRECHTGAGKIRGIFGIPDPEYLKIAMKKGRGEFLLGLFVS
jgi:hypothetical protein